MGRKLDDETGRALRRCRPSPTDEYVSSLARAIGPRPSSHRGGRLAIAVVLSALGALALVFTGGMAQPYAAPKSVASIVKKAVSAKPQARTHSAVVAKRQVATQKKVSTQEAAGATLDAASRQKPATTRKPVTTSAPAAISAAVTVQEAFASVLEPTATVTVLENNPAIDQYLGDEGCSHGFWKNHPEAYPSGVAPGDTLASEGFVGTGSTTFDGALGSGGGGVDALLKQAAAAYLNALSVNYPLSAAQVVSMTNDAIASGNATTIEALKDTLDAFNNLHGSELCD